MEGFIQFIEDADRGVLIGAISAGPHGRRCFLCTLAIHTEAPTRALQSTIYAYSTFHRGIEDRSGACADVERTLRRMTASHSSLASRKPLNCQRVSDGKKLR